ncbi:MAG: hypothetical protein HC769_31815 [Cyanobacteria bacterium CRU_2_1]|nr:hypothetical protein [Cyanobacteria bacterium RU_5_0]NJR62973.1 hypothetical protein [Cyanobacteria bacterium CRU_2_1]
MGILPVRAGKDTHSTINSVHLHTESSIVLGWHNEKVWVGSTYLTRFKRDFKTSHHPFASNAEASKPLPNN